MPITKKEYIKNFIIRSIKGKVDWTEVKQVRSNLMNYTREDWQDLKVIGKELAKEAIDEQINLIKEEEVPSDWKLLARDFSHSAVNLFFAIFNEEVFYQSMLLEKQSGLDQQTKIIKFLPVISQSMDRIVARVPSKSANNWKADKSLTAKVKKVVSEVKGIYFQGLWRKGFNEEEMKQKINKWIKIFESLTAEEIAILKIKLKILANKLIDGYAPPQIKNSPEIRQFINSSINLMDALGDEKLYKDFINIAAKILKQVVQNQQIWDGENPLVLFQNTGTETEVKNLIRNYTQHLNKLAGEGEKNTLSTEREESIIQRLTENNPNPQPSQEDTNLGDVWKDNLLTQGLSAGGNQVNLTEQDLWKMFEDVYTNTQIKPKWYQNPWIIWPLVAGAFVIGGLIVWWLTRRKKDEKIDRRTGYWN